MPRCFSLFRGFFRLLKFDHRDLALFLNDRLRGLFDDALGRQNATDDDTIESNGNSLFLNELGLHFSCNRFLQFRTRGRIGRQLKERILWTSSRTNVRNASFTFC